VFNVTIESQVVHHAPLTFEPTQREDGKWVVDDDHMKIFISERWTLDSGSTNNPVLKFLLFVPSASHRPMYLGEKESKAFLVPQKGSVLLLNPPALEAGAYHLGEDALSAALEQFVADMYALLDLPPIPAKLWPDAAAGRSVRGLADPFTPYQLDTVMRQRLVETEAEARQTLAGIVRLVDKIEEMQVGPGVRDKVLGAVRRLEGVSRVLATEYCA
jgi:phosphatidylinositol glycan class S